MWSCGSPTCRGPNAPGAERGPHPSHASQARREPLDGAEAVLEQSPALTGGRHDRRSPGLNHLALRAGSPTDLDRLVTAAPEHGWRLLFPDRHPFAGGSEHRAAYLEDEDGYEVELVAG